MANPFALASALSTLAAVTCPSCGKRVARALAGKPRLCSKCGKTLPDRPDHKRRR